jgi:flavin reductase (DIM6/NTAB) family NADH-FMN oxidoreductase RutF
MRLPRLHHHLRRISISAPKMSRPDPSTLPRPPFAHDKSGFTLTHPPAPSWTPGSGGSAPAAQHLSIDPYSPSRTPAENYRLLVSGIVPRPIGFVSTVSPSGTRNLAPFSYFSLANHDPPIFTLGFSAGTGAEKDTCANLLATKECTISIISESFAEAANYTAIDAPKDVDEWALSGLTPAESEVVKPAWVKESAFAVEAKVVLEKEWVGRRSGKKTGTLVVVEGVHFHLREDAVKNGVMDLSVLRPVSRLGGIAYGRTTEGFQIMRPRWEEEKGREEVVKALEGEREEAKN